ncbi:hypothetical protein BG004_007063 [Podila humilis]|nr:hypothetical protein BG004_007063 [Podila humilis]
MAGKYVASPTAIEEGQVIAYAALATMAIVPIYFGSFASLKKWKNHKEKKRENKDSTGKQKVQGQEEEEEEEEADVKSESLSIDDALTFPIFGSLGLVGVHLAYKHWNPTYINYAATAYFELMGTIALAQVGVNSATWIVKTLGITIHPYHLSLSRKSSDVYSAKFSVLHMGMLIGSILLSAYYAVTKNWIASNIFSIAFALNAVQLLSLDSFQTGIILMVGFCLYEIGWTRYGAEILRIVTAQIGAVFPLKVVFPWLLAMSAAGESQRAPLLTGFASFGLGDIVIPGLFVALCLRFDQYMAGLRNSALGSSTRFAKPYFIACLTAYLLGLGCSFYLEHTFQIALPTMFYLGPACILSVFLTGSVRGHMQHVFSYMSDEGLEARAERMVRIRELQNSKRRNESLSSSSSTRQGPKVRLPAAIKEETYVPRGTTSKD